MARGVNSFVHMVLESDRTQNPMDRVNRMERFNWISCLAGLLNNDETSERRE
jgi:hypothetical protein